MTVQSGNVATQAGTGSNPMTPAVWAQSLGGSAARARTAARAAASAPSALAKVKLDMNLSVSKSTEIKLEYGGQFGSGYSSNEGILRVNHLF